MDERNRNISDENLAENVESLNVLADLHTRFYAEQDAVLSLIRSPEEQQKIYSERIVLLSQIQLERKVAETGAKFSMAAIQVGLLERLSGAASCGNRYLNDYCDDIELNGEYNKSHFLSKHFFINILSWTCRNPSDTTRQESLAMGFMKLSQMLSDIIKQFKAASEVRPDRGKL